MLMLAKNHAMMIPYSKNNGSRAAAMQASHLEEQPHQLHLA
jgi:hypothetical protein